jgi:hypothetical protein
LVREVEVLSRESLSDLYLKVTASMASRDECETIGVGSHWRRTTSP